MHSRSLTRGFSLIELLIVVAIILIIAAIAIPNMTRAKITANESSAVSSMRTINTAQVAYSTAFPTVGYADNLSKLAPPAGGGPPTSTAAGLIDQVLGCATQPCKKSGYLFSITNPKGSNPVAGYDLYGTPQLVGNSGIRGYCSSEIHLVLMDMNGGTNCTQPVQ